MLKMGSSLGAVNRLLGFRPDDTLATVLDRNRGIGPSFDLLRILLAIVIFIVHARWIAATTELGIFFTNAAGAATATKTATADKILALHWLMGPLGRAAVPAFFALSGFLVLGSALRLRATSTFLAHRALRIFPALLVEVSLSALVLGPLLTSLPIREYFADPQFARYFGNIFGLVTFYLPGVFEHNPVPRLVNTNLWTLPPEFHCYLIIAALLLTMIIYNRKLFVIGFAIATVALATLHYLTGISAIFEGHFPSHVVVYCFFVGAMFYHFREKIPVRFGLFVASLAVTFVGLTFNSLTYIAPIALTYCTVFFGSADLPKLKLISSGDYSYGIYLYGLPIAQAYMAWFPQLKFHDFQLIFLAGTTTCIFAALSWHIIEKRMLALKRHLPESFFPMTERAKSQTITLSERGST